MQFGQANMGVTERGIPFNGGQKGVARLIRVVETGQGGAPAVQGRGKIRIAYQGLVKGGESLVETAVVQMDLANANERRGVLIVLGTSGLVGDKRSIGSGR